MTSSRFRPPAVRALVAGRWITGLVLVAACPAQTIQQVRDQLSEDLQNVAFARSFASLVLLSDELELSGANYRIDDDFDTEISVIALPFQKTLKPWGESATGLHLEGALGYASTSQHVDDIYQGAIPGAETSIDADWTTYGGVIGAGPSFEVVDGLTLTPIFDFGIAYIESKADYGGPGADFSRSLFDGIAFNWNAWAVTYGPSGRVDWEHDLDEDIELSLVGRYDLRWTETIQQDDDAQDFRARLQLLTFRGDLVGPTGLELFEKPLLWRTTVGYRWFLEGDLDGVENFVQVGGGLELDTSDTLPVLGGVSISAAYIYGENITGWTAGLSVSF